MVRIRMQRFGRSHRPFYRIAAVDSREKRNGKVLENLGWYNPFDKNEDQQVSLKSERIRDWISRGAQPSDSVRDMMAKQELLTPEERAAWEAKREVERRRVACKAAVKQAEEAVKGIEDFEGDADTESFLAAAKEARSKARSTVSLAKQEIAEEAAARAVAQLEALQKTDEDAKAKAAAEEAAAAAEAAAAETEAAQGESETADEAASEDADKPAE